MTFGAGDKMITRQETKGCRACLGDTFDCRSSLPCFSLWLSSFRALTAPAESYLLHRRLRRRPPQGFVVGCVPGGRQVLTFA